MEQVNDVRLSGTVKDLKVEYDRSFKWYNVHFKLECVYLCEVPVGCYLICNSKYRRGMLKEGDQVIVEGKLDNRMLPDDIVTMDIQVSAIIHVKGIFHA